MSLAYPPGPTDVPPNLTAPSAAYKRHAWLAMLGLTAFIAVYFALSIWFAMTAWRLLGGMFGANGNFDLWGFVAGICAAFLAVFMLKALFFIQHRFDIQDIEITRAEEPELFEFIDRLADEARAPRAHKVYLSPRVNAAVFYDLSLLNLIIPSKKNLEIGLGLVNVVSLGELKAVLAHEFGHFAQRSMAVGRWVYIAREIAGHVVSRRDALDKLLAQLSRIDLRVAWVGWLLSIIVWSIRSMMEVLFRLVMLAERALSRQMEFQADLVAVSLTGSDALIHALHRLNAADDAWDKTLSFAGSEAGHKRGITDLFAVQARIIDRMREILNQPTYGVVPPMPADARGAHRVFKSELAQPPRMWMTHPPSSDREHNAKQRYVAAAVDERSAWDLFVKPQALKERMSAHVLRDATVEPTPMATTLENLEKLYGRAFLDRRYHGIYLNRSPVRSARDVDELYDVLPAGQELARSLDALYPQSLAGDMELLGEKVEQKHALEALRDQIAQAPGGIIRHNGQELRRADLPRVIAVLEREIAEVRGRIEQHDKRCRTAHLAAAQGLQKGWPDYLRGLLSVLHYADHSEANLRDAQGYVANIYGIVTADGRVSSSELTRLIDGCDQLYAVLNGVYEEVPQVTLDRTLLRRMEVENWSAMLEEFKLPPPNRENIGDWLNVIDGWVGGTLFSLGRLRDAALEQLLLAESQVAKFLRDQVTPADAAPASRVPRDFRRLAPGSERPRQKRLDWWDRFQTADGVVPAIARSSVALGIVGGVVVLGANFGISNVTIFNSLALPVSVQVGDEQVSAAPFKAVTVEVPQSGKVTVRALSPKGELIETFEEELDGANAHYVYNVAGAVPLYEWTAVYTSSKFGVNQPQERQLGNPRWTVTHVDHVFEEPPEQIQVKENSNGYRRVLAAAWESSPYSQTQGIKDEKERTRVIHTHARWDATDSPHYYEWLAISAGQPWFEEVFAMRLKEDTSNVMLLRFEQDQATGDKHTEVCARHKASAAAAPNEPNWQYLGIRCEEDEARRDVQFIAAQQKWPDHGWLAMAAAATRAQQSNYLAAAPLFEKAYKTLPAMSEYLAIDAARVRRINLGMDASLLDLARNSQQLKIYAAIESGAGVEGSTLEPYALIARGQLERAVAASKQAGDSQVDILWLAGASEGATADMIATALDQDVPESADIATMFTMYGLAAREGRDPAPYAQRIEATLGPDAAPLLAFLDQVRRGADALQARDSIRRAHMRVQLFAQNAVVLMRGTQAPSGWREQVERGLFIGERAYMGPPVEEAPDPLKRSSKKKPGEARIISTPVG